jgi:hypothetical protein
MPIRSEYGANRPGRCPGAGVFPARGPPALHRGPLIAVSIASSRAEALRWAVGRIRENPAYEQLQQRVNEINELKSQS